MGKQQRKLAKFFLGGCGLFLILIVVAGPLIIFSSLNPATKFNDVTAASVRFTVEINTVEKGAAN